MPDYAAMQNAQPDAISHPKAEKTTTLLLINHVG